jgi:hypothetical protein
VAHAGQSERARGGTQYSRDRVRAAEKWVKVIQSAGIKSPD